MATLTNASGRVLECDFFLYFRDRHRALMAVSEVVPLPADFAAVVTNRYRPKLRRAYAAAVTGGLVTLNDSPTNITLSATTVAENAGANAVVGTLSTTDANVGNTFTYTLVSGAGSTDNAAFNIAGNQLRATASLNFEAKSSYAIRIRSTDQGGLFTEKTFTITVTNVNEAPTDITLSATTIAENSGANAVIGTFTTTDPDAGDTFTYTLVAGIGATDNAEFNINGNELRANASFNYEAKNSYSVRVRSTDQGGLFTEKAFTITVTNGPG
jgi:mRNA-degrading endonuclease HigB of HigAB toxin-antitoxin module